MAMSIPTILISADEELKIVLRLIYYHVPGFYTTTKQLQKACWREGYDHFFLQDIKKWLKNQYVNQIHRQPQKIKAQAGFGKIKIPNKVHQCDLLPHVRDDQESGKIYLYTLVVIDVATRFKGARSLTSKNSLEVWNAIEEIYNDPNNPLTWPKLLMLDGGKEFSGYFSRGMERYNVFIWVIDLYSFESLAFAKALKRRLAEIIYKIQYAIESKLPAGERSTLWNMILEVIFDYMNNSPTRLIGMTPSHAMTLEKVVSKPSIKPKRPIGEDEITLPKGTSVRYLFKPGELEGGHRRRATDPYWSLRIYKIRKVIVGKNQPQPVLYYLEKEAIESTKHLMGRNPRRPFKREELQIVDMENLEYPPDEFIQKYHYRSERPRSTSLSIGTVLEVAILD